MNINLFQNKVSDWANSTFPNSSLNSKLLHIKEELDEILENPQDIKEWADVLLIYMHAAKSQGFTLSDIFKSAEDKFIEIQSRKWKNPDKNRVVRHE